MRYVLKAGTIVFSSASPEKILVLYQQKHRDFSFPKGHMEIGESETETATRELLEETNTKAEIIEGFRRQIEYPMPKQKDVIKQAVYFLGRFQSGKAKV